MDIGAYQTINSPDIGAYAYIAAGGTTIPQSLQSPDNQFAGHPVARLGGELET